MKSDKEFLEGIYRKAEQRRKEEAEGKMPAVKRSIRWIGSNRIAVIGIMAACFCFLLAFSVYRKKLGIDMESGQQETETAEYGIQPGNPDNGIQMLDLGEIEENPTNSIGWPEGQQRVRVMETPVVLFGTVQSYTKGTEDEMAVLCLETEELEELEIYVTCEEEFTEGEEVALFLMIQEDMYYLTGFGQKYKKAEDGLYYNTFGEVLLEDIGEVFPEM